MVKQLGAFSTARLECKVIHLRWWCRESSSAVSRLPVQFSTLDITQRGNNRDTQSDFIIFAVSILKLVLEEKKKQQHFLPVTNEKLHLLAKRNLHTCTQALYKHCLQHHWIDISHWRRPNLSWQSSACHLQLLISQLRVAAPHSHSTPLQIFKMPKLPVSCFVGAFFFFFFWQTSLTNTLHFR